MNVDAILRHKGRDVATIVPTATAVEAAHELTRRGIGALVVSPDGIRVSGILSERDLAHGLATEGGALFTMPVEELMTREVVTCCPEDLAAELLERMTERRIRHLPVLDEGILVGIVSIGDLVKSRIEEVEFEASSLRSYIIGS